MNFIQPFMLWGMLGIAIPVFIHIWNKQKGKVIEWAASQWLLDKSEQRHRGLRFDNLLLMLLRCLLIVLLAFLLSKPIFNLFGKTALTKIHLVEPQKSVVENYRFELETALKNGEKLYWLDPETSAAVDLAKIPQKGHLSNFQIQQSITLLGSNAELHLYLTNRQELAAGPELYVPKQFQVHPVIDSSSKRLLRFNGISNIDVLLDYQNPTETQTVRSALNALTSVYAFPFSIDLHRKPDKKYDWILTDKAAKAHSGNPGYIFSGLKDTPASARFVNEIYAPGSFQIQTSEIVSTGRLPEWIGEKILDFYGLQPAVQPLSRLQLDTLFKKSGGPDSSIDSKRLQQWLFAAFIGLLLLERGISLNKMNV